MASGRPSFAQELASAGGRAASRALRPFDGAVAAAADAGINLQRRALDRVLESDELERALTTALNSQHLQAALRRALASAGARELIDGFFDSGLFDHFIERLIDSEALWHLVDVIAGSPAVNAAITQQGRGFVDRLSSELRTRSRRADGRVEQAAQRAIRRGPPSGPTQAAGG